MLNASALQFSLFLSCPVRQVTANYSYDRLLLSADAYMCRKCWSQIEIRRTAGSRFRHGCRFGETLHKVDRLLAVSCGFFGGEIFVGIIVPNFSRSNGFEANGKGRARIIYQSSRNVERKLTQPGYQILQVSFVQNDFDKEKKFNERQKSMRRVRFFRCHYLNQKKSKSFVILLSSLHN